MNEAQTCEAPRSPGIEPRWTSSAKSGVGTALLACTHDLGLIVTGEHGFFSEEKRHAEHQIKSLASGIPAYDLVNTHAGHYRITKRIVSDPYRDVVLQRRAWRAYSCRVAACLRCSKVGAGFNSRMDRVMQAGFRSLGEFPAASGSRCTRGRRQCSRWCDPPR